VNSFSSASADEDVPQKSRVETAAAMTDTNNLFNIIDSFC